MGVSVRVRVHVCTHMCGGERGRFPFPVMMTSTHTPVHGPSTADHAPDAAHHAEMQAFPPLVLNHIAVTEKGKPASGAGAEWGLRFKL